MADDILSALKEKEAEMERRVDEARKEAAGVRAGAVEEARAVKERILSETEVRFADLKARHERETAEEISRIVSKAEAEARALEEKASIRMREAVDAVKRAILEG
jgi:vacuolar-type H+-ATPase subunit H